MLPGPVFPSKNCLSYGTYLTDIERKKKRWLKRHKSNSNRYRERFKRSWRSQALWLTMQKVELLRSCWCAMNAVTWTSSFFSTLSTGDKLQLQQQWKFFHKANISCHQQIFLGCKVSPLAQEPKPKYLLEVSTESYLHMWQIM